MGKDICVVSNDLFHYDSQVVVDIKRDEFKVWMDQQVASLLEDELNPGSAENFSEAIGNQYDYTSLNAACNALKNNDFEAFGKAVFEVSKEYWTKEAQKKMCRDQNISVYPA